MVSFKIRLLFIFLEILLVDVSKLAEAQYVILEPHETVQLEHDDRVNRLKRIARKNKGAEPEFHEYFIKKEDHQLDNYPVDIPVLRVVYKGEVFFDFDSDVLTADAQTVIDQIAGSLRYEPADVTVFIAGHTDSAGDEGYNYSLGQQRATSVAIELAYKEIKQSRVYRVSFGELAPIVPNNSEGNRARNRRVEFLFSARSEAIGLWLLEQQKNLVSQKIVKTSPQLIPEQDSTAIPTSPEQHELPEGCEKQCENLIIEEVMNSDLEIIAESVEVELVDDRKKIKIGTTKHVLNLSQKKQTITTY
jgi:outer membrane protein OmpA-like peptidoglycan-associated protein